jgi:lysophospholipase L1-like esterase
VPRRTSIPSTTILLLLVSTAYAQPSTSPSTQGDPGKVRLILPPVIYAVPGMEGNVYFDNVVLVLDPDDCAFDAICAKGKQMDERWTFTPDVKDVGDHPFEIVVRDEANAPVARARSILRVTPADRATRDPTTLLLVGASLTEYSIYPQHILDLDGADEHLNLKLIGSRGGKDGVTEGSLRHEGYSGWTAQAFCTTFGPLSRKGIVKRPDTGSPFLYKDAGDAQPHLDFARYCKEFNGGQAPDVIVIHLIVNDIFRENDATIDACVDKMLGYYDQLITEFHRVRPDTRIGVILTIPDSRSQDGFRNYNRSGDRQTRVQVRRNLHRAWERMIERYAGRESEQVYLVPEYVSFDTARGYPTFTAPAHARSSEKVTRVNNGTHPNADGYRQMGDSIYMWIKAVGPGKD